MKNRFFYLAAILSFLVTNTHAQFTDDFETCVNGYNELPHWGNWGCGGGEGCGIACSNDFSLSGNQSGYIPGDGTTDAILDLGNKIFGEWGLEFWMYIPTGQEAYWNLQGIVPIGAGEWIVGNIFFNQDLATPGEGHIDDSALGDLYFNFPHDQWFRVVMNFDFELGISVATWQFNVDGIDVIPSGTAFTNLAGTIPTGLGGMDFFSISSNNQLYLDDFVYVNEFILIDPSPAPVTDDMESYTDGEPIYEDWWSTLGCGDDLGCALESSSAQANSGLLSGLVPGDGTTDVILDLGNKIFGEWGLEFWMYVPSDKEAYFALKGCVPICTEDFYIHVFLNQDLASPGEGVFSNTALGDVNFDFPHDQWFRIVMNVDISSGIALATWQVHVDGEVVIPSGTAFTNSAGEIPISLGGINFFSISTNNEYYVDDFNYIDGTILATVDYSEAVFSVSPNPASDMVYISSEENIETLRIYALSGRLVQELVGTKTVDVSALTNGMYFIEATTSTGKGVQKLIKK